MPRQSWTLLAAALALTGASSAHSAKTFNACRTSAGDAYSSCREGARSDRLILSGRCANLSDKTARKACDQEASMEATDARETCTAQRDARRTVCDRLGPAPYLPAIDPANFVTTIDNPLFPLVPGTTFVYQGQTAGGLEIDNFAVTHNTRVIMGVTCVEVHDTVTVDGKPTEDTLDWFSQDKDGNVWYFGENSREIVDGLIAGIEGSWIGGVDGAQPGIIMEAHPAVGDFYRQEFLLGDAEDLAEVTSLTESVTVPLRPEAYDDCIKREETSPIEPDALESKYYAAGVGNVLTVDLSTGETSELVQILTE
jgi:hypothetical protein